MESIYQFISGHGAKGLILVSGSRSITDFEYAEIAIQAALKRQYAIMIGDAKGVDTSAARLAVNAQIPLVIVGCQSVGKIRITSIDFKNNPRVMTRLVVGGDVRGSAFLWRDEMMAIWTSAIVKSGFIGIWDGRSRGTIYTANHCKRLQIPGIIFNATNGSKEVWGGNHENNNN